MRIRISSIEIGSPAHASGLSPGDEVASIDGTTPFDVLDYARLAAEPGALVALADGRHVPAAALSGASLDEAVFDGVQTCDNHCEFCFIYQLPKGLRASLYAKDDDYRLSALYGNFTTLTRFTELDLERAIDERISPLYVSIHTTHPQLRASMLRNAAGSSSLRWLRALLDAGLEVHGQVVCCPGTNDAGELDATLAGLLAGYAELASVGVVPLGVSRFNSEPGLRPQTAAEATGALDSIHAWQDEARAALGRRFVFASDEFYLLAGEPFPPAEAYEGFPQYENGIGMAAALAADLGIEEHRADGAPPWGYRAVRVPGGPGGQRQSDRVAIMTGELGFAVVSPLVGRLGAEGVQVHAVENRYFGGNVGVTGLLAGEDLATAIAALDAGVEAVLPDVCLNEGRTLDEWTPERIASESGHAVRVVTADAAGLRAAVGVAA